MFGTTGCCSERGLVAPEFWWLPSSDLHFRQHFSLLQQKRAIATIINIPIIEADRLAANICSSAADIPVEHETVSSVPCVVLVVVFSVAAEGKVGSVF